MAVCALRKSRGSRLGIFSMGRSGISELDLLIFMELLEALVSANDM